jgi:hypothetical protein
MPETRPAASAGMASVTLDHFATSRNHTPKHDQYRTAHEVYYALPSNWFSGAVIQLPTSRGLIQNGFSLPSPPLERRGAIPGAYPSRTSMPVNPFAKTSRRWSRSSAMQPAVGARDGVVT